MRLIFIASHTQVHAWAKLFEVDDVALSDAHAGASVESGGACDAFGVHAEGDLIDASALVLGEGVAEEGESEPTLPPRAPYPDDVDPTLAGQCLAEGDARNLVAVHGQEPEGRIEALHLRLADEPFERAAWPSPHIPKGVRDG